MRGWKTWIGTIGWAACEGAKTLLPEYASLISLAQNGVFLPLGVIGIGHKIDRASAGG